MNEERKVLQSVLLRILDVSNVSENNEQARSLELNRILQGLLGKSGKKCYHAEDYLRIKKLGGQLPINTDMTRQEIRQNITKFVKTTDQVLSLASFLLKSEAFFLAHSYSQDAYVQLPRTMHQKPYIPSIDATASPISLSHQWPFIGIIQLSAQETKHNLQVGLDIVVIEKINHRLYNTVEDFVNVFKENFTDNEWQTITKEKETLLQEFYVQWSVKEAVTKALGIGIAFDFSSFEVEWNLASPGKCGLWNTLVRHGTLDDAGVRLELIGTVVRKCTRKSTTSRPLHDMCPSKWRFSFVALSSTNTCDYKGVACSCLGPFAVNSVSLQEPIEWRIEWTSLDSLLSGLL